MRRLVETMMFLGLALSLHMAIFAQKPSTGSEAGGVGGEVLVSLTGATPQIAVLVERWEQPPETSQQPDTPTPPIPVESVQPDMPQVDLPVASRAPVQLPTSEQSLRPRLPEIETTTPQPPEPSRRPPSRPKQAEPSGTAQVTQTGRATQRAAGAGGQQQAGQSAAAQTSIQSPGQVAQLQAVWGAQIRSRIERGKRFPPGATGSGRVVVVITVSRSGRMMSYQIRTSSGSGAFDTSAMQAVARATRLPAAPPELKAPQYDFALPIVFSR